MGKVIYSLSVSLDGFAAATDGSLDWVVIDDEIHQAFNDQSREMSASLYGRRMYELMSGYWPTGEEDPAATPVTVEFSRIWMATPKIVFSRTLDRVDWNSRLVAGDAIEEVARLKAQPGFDMDVGGPTLAGSLLRAGLVDELRILVNPVVLGAGLPFYPPLEAPVRTRLVETRVFESGVVYQRHEVVSA